MGKTSIEWADETWNPVVGCTRTSPGCLHCYAEIMGSRQVLMSAALGRRSPYLRVVDADNRRWSRPKDVKADPANHQHVELLPERLDEPLSFPAGSKVFVVSMGDLFHEHVPFEFIARVWAVMAARRDCTFQVLTKRPARMVEFLVWLEGPGSAPAQVVRAMIAGHWPLPNVWLGTSVEDQKRADQRIPLLLAASAASRFLSVEPLLGPIDLGRWIGNYNCHPCGARFWSDELNILQGVDLVTADHEHDPEYPDDDERTRDVCPVCRRPDLGSGDVGPASTDEYEGKPTIDLVIVGGESGPGARPMHPDWVRSLREQCRFAELLDGGRQVAFFFKQWGGVHKGKAGRVLDGRTHDAMPEVRHG
jgi:protein gp37